MAGGEEERIRIRVVGGHQRIAGFSLWATEGELAVDPATPNPMRTISEFFGGQQFAGVLTHSSPGDAEDGAVEWWATLRAPDDAAEVRLVVSAISANQNGGTSGDLPTRGERTLEVECEDLDEDGHEPLACGGTDCDDGQFGVAPGRAEVCDGVDQDCDGGIDEGVVAPDDLCLGQGVCEDAVARCAGGAGWVCDLPPSYEDGIESRCDGLDNDCDGATDEPDDLDHPGDLCPDEGVCVDGVTVCAGVAGWQCAADGFETVEHRCDGLDNDCDGFTDEDPVPPEGVCPEVGVCVESVTRCEGAAGWDCIQPETFEGVERSCDGRDNDCDGATDEEQHLDEPPDLDCPVGGICGLGLVACTGARGWACDLPNTYERAEFSCDGIDNDCDGQTDEAVPPPPDLCPEQGVCVLAVRRCGPLQGGGVGWICDTPDSYEPEDEVSCDGRDNDCDGATDEGPDEGDPALTRSCDNACGVGVQTCEDGDFVDCDAPVATDERCDGEDNDCDGDVDEAGDLDLHDPPPVDICPPFGVCRDAGPQCAGADGWACAFPDSYEEVETLCDGLDNDCDRFADADCVCEPGVQTRACGTDRGACRSGVNLCPDGRWAEACTGGIAPADEVCDDIDNDCDGRTDESVIRPCATRCGEGEERCRAGQWGPCSAPAADSCPPDPDPIGEGEGEAEAGAEGEGEIVAGVGEGEGEGEGEGQGEGEGEGEPPQPGFCDGPAPLGRCPEALGVCTDATLTCTPQTGWVCNLPATFEFGETRCDELDNDCDGRTDPQCPEPPGPGDEAEGGTDAPDPPPDPQPNEGEGEADPSPPPFDPPGDGQGCCTQAAPGAPLRRAPPLFAPRR